MKTIPTNIRFDKKLLEEIAFIAEQEGIDKTAWIKRTLMEEVRYWYEEIRKQLAENYIKLRIDDVDYLRLSKSKTIPIEIKKAREQFLQVVVNSKEDTYYNLEVEKNSGDKS